MDYLELIGENVIIIKYTAPSSRGLIIVLRKYYEKKLAKFKKAFKDAEIYYMNECILTEEILEKEFKL